MNNVTVTIDISTPAGRRIVRDLEKHKEVVHIENPIPEEKSYTVKEVFSKVEKKLNDRYGTNYKFEY